MVSIHNNTGCLVNELEVLLKKSFDEEILVNVTLKNNKFYIGWASALPVHHNQNV